MPSHRPADVPAALSALEQWIRRLTPADLRVLVSAPAAAEMVRLVQAVGREIEAERAAAAADIDALISGPINAGGSV